MRKHMETSQYPAAALIGPKNALLPCHQPYLRDWVGCIPANLSPKVKVSGCLARAEPASNLQALGKGAIGSQDNTAAGARPPVPYVPKESYGATPCPHNQPPQ